MKQWLVTRSKFFLSTLCGLFNMPFENVMLVEKEFFNQLEKMFKNTSKN